MVYYWCKLQFNGNLEITERRAIKICYTEQELIEYMSETIRRRRTYPTAFHEPNPELEMAAALTEIEKSQQLTGTDIHYSCNQYNIPQYFICDMQLCGIDNFGMHVLNINTWHDKIIAHALAFYEMKPHYGYHQRQGKTHKKYGSYHNHAHMKQTLSFIERNMMRPHYAAYFDSSVGYDPKYAPSENNWKQKKCRHQWQWHKPSHCDTVPKSRRNLEQDDNWVNLEKTT